MYLLCFRLEMVWIYVEFQGIFLAYLPEKINNTKVFVYLKKVYKSIKLLHNLPCSV